MGRPETTLLIGLLIFLAGTAALLTPQGGVDAVGDPEITIALAQAKQTVYVAPGQDGIVTFTGTVFVQVPWSPNIQYLVVDLSADAGSWPVSVPPSLTFSKAVKQQSFTISVQAPIGAPADESHTLTVGGTWHYEPGMTGGQCEPATAIILIKQYYTCDLETKTPFIEALANERLDTSVLVKNTGNGDDEIQLEIANHEDLAIRGIDVYLSDSKVSVEYNETVETGIIIQVDRYAAHGPYDIEVKAWSAYMAQLGENPDPTSLTIFLDVVTEKSYVEPEPEPDGDDDEPEPEPEPDPEPDDDDAEPEPESEPVPDDDDTVDDEVSLEEPEQTDAGGDRGSSILIPLVVIGIILLFVIVPGALYFLIRRSGSRKVKVNVIE